MSYDDVLIKLGLALLLGGAIGIEREISHKPAGFRTNVLICLTSAMVMILAEKFTADTGTGPDSVMRVAAGVITGVGFLGAGAIIQSRGSIHGLTTASVIWAVAGLGLVIGAGYFIEAALFAAVVIVTLIVFRKIEKLFGHVHEDDNHHAGH